MPLFPPLAVEALLSEEGRVRCFPLNAARGAEPARRSSAAAPASLRVPSAASARSTCGKRALGVRLGVLRLHSRPSRISNLDTNFRFL